MKPYTDKEMILKMDELKKQGKSPLEILKDPRCKDNFKDKIYKLYDIELDHIIDQRKKEDSNDT